MKGDWITMGSGEKCPQCGSKVVLRRRLGGDRRGNRYYVCSRFPRCNYRRLYAEEGKPLSPWVRIGRMFFRS
ncbi:MAG: hypothetical protein FIA89_12590 [Geobacter sp.]|nr:hypothetical protein [Geobacter sp.]